MLNTALRFMSECERAEIKYKETRETEDGASIVVCGFNGKHNARYDVMIIFDKSEKSAGLRVFQLAAVDEEKRDEMLRVINRINSAYRWIKLTMNDEGQVAAEADAVITQETVGPVCIEVMLRLVNILNDVYPDIMRAMWA